MKWIFGTLLLLFATLLAFVGIDRFARYDSWRTLDAETIRNEAVNYVERYEIDDVGICVYAVTCDTGAAQLSLIPDLDAHDFEQTRELIWARRFDGECSGQTANVGLHIIPVSRRTREVEWYQRNAIWSFGTDRFLRKWGNHSSGAFSEEPWQRCTPDNFAFTRIDGEITLPPETGID